jgi:hypothetical protein
LRRREQLIDPKIAELSGHIVKTAGDGMLINQGCDASRVTGDLVDRSRTAAATAPKQRQGHRSWSETKMICRERSGLLVFLEARRSSSEGVVTFGWL